MKNIYVLTLYAGSKFGSNNPSRHPPPNSIRRLAELRPRSWSEESPVADGTRVVVEGGGRLMDNRLRFADHRFRSEQFGAAAPLETGVDRLRAVFLQLGRRK